MHVLKRRQHVREHDARRKLGKSTAPDLFLPDDRVEQIAPTAILQNQRHRLGFVEVLVKLHDVPVFHFQVRLDLAILPEQVPHIMRLQPCLAHDFRGPLFLGRVAICPLRRAPPYEAEGPFAQRTAAEEAVLVLEFLLLQIRVVAIGDVRKNVRAALLAHQSARKRRRLLLELRLHGSRQLRGVWQPGVRPRCRPRRRGHRGRARKQAHGGAALTDGRRDKARL
mmetsp:Transcript_44564/g.123456  ORF Transcript_44564/g.123456 Transcript_44564/m.123456 type:complete len:224 (-) Transcript_44564:597-1268(-)